MAHRGADQMSPMLFGKKLAFIAAFLFSIFLIGQTSQSDNQFSRLPSREVYHVVENSEGNLIVCTEQGAFLVSGAKVIPLNKSTGGELSAIYNLYIDPTDRVWAMTASSGIFYLENEQWIAASFNDDLLAKLPTHHFIYYMWVSENGEHIILDGYINDLTFYSCTFSSEKVSIHIPFDDEHLRVCPAIIKLDGNTIFSLSFLGDKSVETRMNGYPSNGKSGHEREVVNIQSDWGDDLEIIMSNLSHLQNPCTSAPPPRRALIKLSDVAKPEEAPRQFYVTHHFLFEIFEDGSIHEFTDFCNNVAFRVIDNQLYACSLFEGIRRYELRNGQIRLTGHFDRGHGVSDIMRARTGEFLISDVNDGLRVTPNIDIKSYRIQDLAYPYHLSRPFHYFNGQFYSPARDTMYTLQVNNNELTIHQATPINSRTTEISHYNRVNWQGNMMTDIFFTTTLTSPIKRFNWSNYPKEIEPSYPFIGTNLHQKSICAEDWTVLYTLNDGRLFSIDTNHVFKPAVSEYFDSLYLLDFSISNNKIDLLLTEREVYRISGDTFTSIITAPERKFDMSAKLYQLAYNWIAIPLYGNGINLYHDDTVLELRTNNWLPDNFITSITTTDNTLFGATSKEVFFVRVNNDQEVEHRILPLATYLKEEAIREIVTGDSSLFVFYGDHVINVPFDFFYNLPTEVNFSFSDVQVNGIGGTIDEHQLLTVERGSSVISFRLEPLDGTTPNEKLLWRWRLKNSDPWTYSGDGFISLSNLMIGQYSVEAQMRSKYGVWSDVKHLFTFSIRPVVTSTWWFWGMITSPLVIILMISIKGSIKRRRQDKELIESNMATLKMQINPHFIFNAFNSIQYLIESKRNETASVYLNQLATLIRKTISRPDLHRVSLQEEIQYIEEYMSIELMRLDNQFKFHLNVDESIDTRAFFIPPMLLQPLLENAVWHGVSDDPSLGEISIEIVNPSKSIQIHIRDNGSGFPLEKWEALKNGTLSTGSIGMLNVLQRLRLLSELDNKEHSLNLLSDSKGTHFVLTIEQ